MHPRNRLRAAAPRWLSRFALSAALTIAALAGVACDGDSSPAPPPPALLVAHGELGFSCNIDCSFQGQATNNGAGCADTVRGITRLLDSNGDEIDSEDWDLDPARRIQPGETFLYQECCFSFTQMSAMSSYETEIFWNNLPCQ